MVGIAVDSIRLSNSPSGGDEKLVLGSADTNLDQDDILPSISNSDSDVVVSMISGRTIESKSLSLFFDMASSERGRAQVFAVGSGHDWVTADLDGRSNGRGGARLST